MMGQRSLGERYEPDLPALAKHYLGETDGKLAAQVARSKIASYQIHMKSIQITSARANAEIKSGGMSLAPSTLKYAMSLAFQDKFELLEDILGNKGLLWQEQDIEQEGKVGAASTDDEYRAAKEWAFSKIQTIGGGTSEIQLNIIAKQILGLPE